MSSSALVIAMKRILCSVMLSSCLGFAAHAGTIEDRLQTAVTTLEPTARVRVIIVFTNPVDLAPYASGGRGDMAPLMLEALKRRTEQSRQTLEPLLRASSATDVKNLWIINALAARVPVQSINSLAKAPQVASVRLDGTIRAPTAAVAEASTPGWNLEAVGIPALWQHGYTGQGVVVANMDTGVDGDHPDLRDKWRGGANSWFDPYGEHPAPADRNGHGTQTMGVMVGGDSSGTGIGLAPDAQWIAVKIFNDNDVALESAIHEGFQWLLDPDGDPDTQDPPDIVNNSWGYNAKAGQCVFADLFGVDIQVLKTAGIAVVVAAGNSGPNVDTSVSPANYASSLSVGAVDESLTVASFSSRGPSSCDGSLFPLLAAPGKSITTSDLSLGGLPLYATLDGTSFAAPHVAGAMALLRSALSGIAVTEMESALEQSAQDGIYVPDPQDPNVLIPMPGPDNNYGYGVMDAAAAYGLARCPAGGGDSDGDLLLDGCDNCIGAANHDQRDSNGDGYGNACDPDLNGDGMVDLADFLEFIPLYGTNAPEADFNGNGAVDLADYLVLKGYYGSPPGPSAVAN